MLLGEHGGSNQCDELYTSEYMHAALDIMPAPMTAKMVRARKGEAQSPQPKWSCHQSLRSVHLNQRLIFVIWSFRFSVPKLRISDGLYLDWPSL